MPTSSQKLFIIWLSKISTLSVHDEDYSRNASCSINWISTCLFTSEIQYIEKCRFSVVHYTIPLLLGNAIKCTTRTCVFGSILNFFTTTKREYNEYMGKFLYCNLSKAIIPNERFLSEGTSVGAMVMVFNAFFNNVSDI